MASDVISACSVSICHSPMKLQLARASYLQLARYCLAFSSCDIIVYLKKQMQHNLKAWLRGMVDLAVVCGSFFVGDTA